MSIRQPAVAGTFYPEDPEVLRNTVQHLLEEAKQHSPAPKALIVPHAGFMYSGPIAASAYASLINQKDKIKRIILLGPAHTVFLRGIAYDPVDQFATPLGIINQDKELLEKISLLPYVHALPQAHQMEHCLEVQWPFLQMIFSQFTLLPLVVGETSEEDIAKLIALAGAGEDTLIIISSDLSHYLPYEMAQKTDSSTCLSIDTLENESISHHGACGYYPLCGFLHFARQNQYYGRLLDLRNSGDTAGSKEKVVGYASYHFYQNLRFSDYCGDELIYLAKEAIRLEAEENKLATCNYTEFNDLLKIRVPTFVTLKKNGLLRGCMGSLTSQDRLADNVIHNALHAGFADPRFPRLDPEELSALSLSISILSPLERIHFTNESDLKYQLRPGIDGLLLSCNHYQATFLPSVWESLTTKDAFLEQLKLKMGLPAYYWSANMKAQRYTTEVI